MKPKIFTLGMMILVLSACNIPVSATPAQFETPVIVATSTTSTGGTVTLNNVSFTIPLGVAMDAQSEMVPAVTDSNNSPWWEVAPEHTEFTLTGYQIQDELIKPQIFVYPVEAYADLNTNASDQIQKLKTILAGGSLTKYTLPNWLINAGQLFAAKSQVVPFQNGRGVRFLTQYDQYPAPINNHELVYHFQGLTDDGKYYVVAVLPVTSSILADSEKPEATVPSGGVSLPASGGPDQAYYEAVTKALDAMYEDSFNPSLFQLDALIQSITVTP
jgi:hypothetical protein